MKDKKFSPDGRVEAEKAEGGLETTGMPKSRLQGEVQTSVGEDNALSANDALDVVAKTEKKVRDRIKVRPDSANSLKNDSPQIAGFSSGSQPLGASAVGFGSVPVQDASRVPYNRGGNRPNDGFSRKLSNDDVIIDNAVCEQIAPEFTDMTPLSAAEDQKMFYSGRAKFTQERGKKTGGYNPQSLVFDRSIDFEKVDVTVHTTGQVLATCEQRVSPIATDAQGKTIVKALYPTTCALANTAYGEENITEGYKDADIQMRKSNYLLKDFSFTITADDRGNKRITGIAFGEDETIVTPSVLGQEQANLNWQVDRNNVSKAVINLQTKLGRETTNEWSGLGYATLETMEYNHLYHDIEATTGAIMGTAYRAANSSLAYQQGLKLRKDGARSQDPAVDMFLNGIAETEDSSIAISLLKEAGSFTDAIFNPGLYSQGSAAAMIQLFDSVGKYKSKANIFNSQKSLKQWVQTMDNNINVFYAKKDYLMALDTAHVFSTIDGNYNPMLPIIATRCVGLQNPLSLNAFAIGFNRDKWGAVNDPEYTSAGTKKHWAIKWKDVRNVYFYGATHPIVDGLADWMILHEQAIVRLFASNLSAGNSKVVTIPASFNMLAPTLFTFMLCAASQRIAYHRQLDLIPVLQASDQIGYIYEDLTSLKELNFKFSSNFTLTDYKTPSVPGKLKAASAIRHLFPETFSTFFASNPSVGTSTVGIALPWYFSEEQCSAKYDAQYSGFLRESSPAMMSYPSTRHGVVHEYTDFIYSMSPRDVRLSLDRMTEVPLPVEVQISDASIDAFDPYSYVSGNSYRTAANIDDSSVSLKAIRYDKQSDGRVAMILKNKASGPKAVLTRAAVYCAPRELGYLISNLRIQPLVDKINILTKADTDKGIRSGDVQITVGGMFRLHALLDGSCSNTLVSYSAFGPVNKDGVIVDQSAALSQQYSCFFADRTQLANNYNTAFINKTNICPSSSYMFSGKDGAITLSDETQVSAIYELGGLQPASGTFAKKFTTFVPIVWTWLNRTYRPIDVYQNFKGDASDPNPDINNQQPPTNFAPYDVMENAFYFNLCGFLAADYNQDVLDRSERVTQLNMFYDADDFISSSLIFRQ